MTRFTITTIVITCLIIAIITITIVVIVEVKMSHINQRLCDVHKYDSSDELRNCKSTALQTFNPQGKKTSHTTANKYFHEVFPIQGFRKWIGSCSYRKKKVLYCIFFDLYTSHPCLTVRSPQRRTSTWYDILPPSTDTVIFSPTRYGRVRHLYLKLVYGRRGCWIHFQQKIKIEMKPSHQTEHIYFLFSKFMKKDDF